VAQSVGPEFKPQYHKKKKKREREREREKLVSPWSSETSTENMKISTFRSSEIIKFL
jgi:hypothetical protein